MTDLLSRVPRTAQLTSDATVIEIPIGAVAVGDRLLIRCGDVVPVDGTVDGRTALVDPSALTA